MAYRNFDLRLGMAHGDGCSIEVLDSPIGPTSRPIKTSNPLLDDWLREAVEKLRSPSPPDLKILGQCLTDYLFPHEIWTHLRGGLERARGEGYSGLRIRLRLDVPELAVLPWELCYDSERDNFLALDRGMALVRYLPVASAPGSVEAPSPMHVLIVASSPQDLPPLDVESELEKLKQALARLESSGDVELTYLDRPATAERLQDALRRDVHVLHYLGHGVFDAQSDRGYLFLEQEDGTVDELDVTQVRTLLQGSSVRVVVLNACQSAGHGARGIFSGVAQSLVRAEVPAVVAMQDVMSDHSAVTFTRNFYNALSDLLPLDEALTEARIALRAQSEERDRSWSIPVLFMRTPDGVIWPKHERKLSRAWEAKRDFIHHATRAYADTMQTERSLPGSPYKFLFSFRLKDASIFYGRDEASEALLKRVQGEDERHRLTVLHAPSGAGKTSLLNAGLSPRLLAAGGLPIYARTYNDPIGAVKKVIVDAAADVGPDLSDLSLHRFLKTAAEALPAGTKLVICLDQFEEFFIYLDEDTQQAAFHEIAACYQDHSLPTKLILSLRADYFSELGRFEAAIPTLFFNHLRLESMTRDEARQAIVAPAQAFGVSYEPALVDRLLAELEQAKMSPPQLQILCDQLFSKRQDQVISLGLYQSLGGAQGILEGYLAEVLATRLRGRNETLAKAVLVELVSAEGGQGTGIPQDKTTLLTRTQADSQQLEFVLSRLLDARLIERVVMGEGERYELTHEHLILEISNWIGRDQLLVKRIRELLRRRLDGYIHYDLLLDEKTLETIRLHLPSLQGLSIEEIDMIYHSALVTEYEADHWLELMAPEAREDTVRRVLGKLLDAYLKAGNLLPASGPLNVTTLNVIHEHVPDLGTLQPEAVELIVYSALALDHQAADWLDRVDAEVKRKVLVAGLDSGETDLQIRAARLARHFALLDLTGRLERLSIEAPASTLRLEAALALVSLDRERAIERFASALGETGGRRESALLTLVLLRDEGLDLIRSSQLNSFRLRWQINRVQLGLNRSEWNRMVRYVALGGAIGGGIGGWIGSFISLGVRGLMVNIGLSILYGLGIGVSIGVGFATVRVTSRDDRLFRNALGAAVGGGLFGLLTGLADVQVQYVVWGAPILLVGGFISGAASAAVADFAGRLSQQDLRFVFSLVVGVVFGAVSFGPLLALGAEKGVVPVGPIYGYWLGTMMVAGITAGAYCARWNVLSRRRTGEEEARSLGLDTQATTK
jgi:hypothetical protein